MTRSGGAGRAKPPAARAKPPKTKPPTNEGRWTDEEHRKFLEAYDEMVAVDPARRRWPNVAVAVGVEIKQSSRRSRRWRGVDANAPSRIIYTGGRRHALDDAMPLPRAEVRILCGNQTFG